VRKVGGHPFVRAVQEDADQLITAALEMDQPDYALKRSLTGTKGGVVGGGATRLCVFRFSAPSVTVHPHPGSNIYVC
jgi:hypothetical protein